MGKLRMVRDLAAAGALLLLSTVQLGAATWYVDSAAVGANNGTSWANAWNSLTAINWGSVANGDTVQISGGPAGGSKIYSAGPLTAFKVATPSARITIRNGIDAAHSGRPVINGTYFTLTSSKYIDLRNLMWANYFNTTTPTFANAVMADATEGVRFYDCIWSNVNNAINYSSSTKGYVTNALAKEIRGDAFIRGGSVSGTGYEGGCLIENCDVEILVNSIDGGGPDGIQTGNQMTARNNIFRVRRVNYYTSNQHNDMFQCPGVDLAIYNNEFINVGDSSIAMGAWWAGSVHRNIQIYNNIFRIVTAIDPFPEFIRIYNNVGPIATMENIVIANNLFIDNTSRNNIFFGSYAPDGLGNPVGTGLKIINNIFYNSGSGFCWVIQNSSGFNASTWEIRNNVYYPGGNSFVSWLCPNTTLAGMNSTKFNMDGSGGLPNWLTFGKEISGSAGQVIFSSYTPNGANNDFHLSGSDTVAKATGYNMSAFFTIDADDLTRSVPWDRGAYLFPGAGASQLTIQQASYTYSEADGNATITLGRSGSLSGAVSVTLQTADGTALNTVNYTGGSFTVNWANGDGADKTVNIPLIDTDFVGTKTFSASIHTPTGGAQLGAQTSTTINLTGTGVPPGDPIISGWYWPVTNTAVQIAIPFQLTGDYVSQNSAANIPADGGSLRIRFTNYLANFKFRYEVNAPSGAANSFWYDVNQEPSDPEAIDDVVNLVPTGFEWRDGTWRGLNGTFETPEFSPKVFTIPAGTNTLIVRGREPIKIRTIELVQITPEEPTSPAQVISVTSTNLNGYYNAGKVIELSVLFNTNVVVTGSPRVLLNSMGYANYDQTASTTNTLVFTNLVAAGQNSQALDYASTAALQLNGGTIENDGITSDLTLPVPGTSGSLSSSVQLVVDTIAPTMTIGQPTVTSDIRFPVSWSDINLAGQSLASTNVNPIFTGTLVGSPSIISQGNNLATVVLSGLVGEGTVAIQIFPGTAADLAGNVAPGATSDVAPFEVSVFIIRRGQLKRLEVPGRQ